MSYFAIAGLQLALGQSDNLSRLEAETRLTCQRFPWVDMVIFSELAPFGSHPAFREPMPGPTEERLQALARELEIWLVPGSMYERAGDQVFNTVQVINPQGEIVSRYRKMYPFQPYEQGISAGNEFVVFDVPDVGRFGVSICYDMWVPETIRAMVWQGAEVIIHPTMTGTLDRELECCMARTHAVTNQCYFVDINSAGNLGNGQSIVVGPDGDILYQAGTTEQVIALELDLNRVRRSRERGVLGLGQILKSYRDHDVIFPQYQGDRSPYLDRLDTLKVSGRAALCRKPTEL
ncbi:carbon-nitrogen hydrolase family protein [Photobacterium salinisoli]|uniref:carbon-nitrogen hydrolase family protein n=1 Tax=Photobacterium salinisoli TaxID=1616783 RepID=UPI000EA24290|nr:carbon-nitrogen hydrolase family protein [Photobacterium salinisoli]